MDSGDASGTRAKRMAATGLYMCHWKQVTMVLGVLDGRVDLKGKFSLSLAGIRLQRSNLLKRYSADIRAQ